MVCLKSFETQEVRAMKRKEADESRGFPRLMDGNKQRCLPDGRKKMQRPGKTDNISERRRKIWERNPCQSEEGALSGPVTVDEERFVAAARNSAGEKGKQKDE